MRVTITIDVDNASFDDPHELERVLASVTTKIRHRGYADEYAFELRDTNGNRVGVVTIAEL